MFVNMINFPCMYFFVNTLLHITMTYSMIRKYFEKAFQLILPSKIHQSVDIIVINQLKIIPFLSRKIILSSWVLLQPKQC